MSKSNKYGKPSGGEVLAIKCHKNGQVFIGRPNHMFEYAHCESQARRICMMFGISNSDLEKELKRAQEQKEEFVFVTL